MTRDGGRRPAWLTAAIRKRAAELGTTPQRYVNQVLAEHVGRSLDDGGGPELVPVQVFLSEAEMNRVGFAARRHRSRGTWAAEAVAELIDAGALRRGLEVPDWLRAGGLRSRKLTVRLSRERFRAVERAAATAGSLSLVGRVLVDLAVQRAGDEALTGLAP